MQSIKNYIWFIRASQDFMKGYNPVVVFIQSLYKGIGFCKLMKPPDSKSIKFDQFKKSDSDGK